jgi:tetratricopeptide (TPR) repeat protein
MATINITDPGRAMHRAALLERQNRLPEAEQTYRQILVEQPIYHPAYHGLALLAYRLGNLPVAIEMMDHAIRLGGRVGIYFRDRGEMHRQNGQPDKAIRDAAQAVILLPQDPDAFYNLGLAFADRGDYEVAVRHYQKALALQPKHGKAWNNMGSALEKQDLRKDAEKAYRKAISLNPHHVEAQNNLGTLLSQQGDFEAASQCFETALADQPQFIPALQQLAQIRTLDTASPYYNTIEYLAATPQNRSVEDQAKLLFALGKIRDDNQQYEAAFQAWNEANRLQRSTLKDTEPANIAQCNSLMAHMDQAFFAAGRTVGCEDPTPIFVVGMPRSGTTLTEQILSSHPEVYGAGELKDLHSIVNAAVSKKQGSFGEKLAALGDREWRRIGEQYIEAVRKHSRKARFIVDKMPANYFYIGAIHKALPQAKIIHTPRDPMDSCLSNYIRLYYDTMEFSYNLETLGRYYVRYAELMKHWHAVLPAGRIFDSRYEQMVEDQEGQTRKLLAHVGLGWHEACLEFHKNKREVRTASLTQVRQPIYKTSKGGWKRFEQQLQPLLNIVKDYR